MPRKIQQRIHIQIPTNTGNRLAGIPQIKNAKKDNLFMLGRIYRFFNIAKPKDYHKKEAHEGITRKSVGEQERATGEVQNI